MSCMRLKSFPLFPEFHFSVSSMHCAPLPPPGSYCYSFSSVLLSEYIHTCMHTQHKGGRKRSREKTPHFKLTWIAYFVLFSNFLFCLTICTRDKSMLFHSSSAFLFNSIITIGNIHLAIFLLVDIDIVSNCLPAMLKQSYIFNLYENSFLGWIELIEQLIDLSKG